MKRERIPPWVSFDEEAHRYRRLRRWMLRSARLRMLFGLAGLVAAAVALILHAVR